MRRSTIRSSRTRHHCRTVRRLCGLLGAIRQPQGHPWRERRHSSSASGTISSAFQHKIYSLSLTWQPGQTVADLGRLPRGPMARRILAESRSFTPSDRPVSVDARWHSSWVLLGRAGAPDYRRPSRPDPPLAGCSIALMTNCPLVRRGDVVHVDPPYQTSRQALPPRS